jgi:hypothetical protein
MKPVGSRMPSGGRAGDTYTAYPGMAINDDISKVKKHFAHAMVRFKLLSITFNILFYSSGH